MKYKIGICFIIVYSKRKLHNKNLRFVMGDLKNLKHSKRRKPILDKINVLF